MAHGAFQDLHCPFAGSSRLGGWFAPIPCGGRVADGPSWRRASVFEAYLIMVGVVAAAALIRLAIDPFVVGTQFPFFFLAAIVCTFIGGVCVGLLSIPLSALAAWYYFVGPKFSFVLAPGEAYALITFATVAAVMVYIIGSLQAADRMIDRGVEREAVLAERARVADELRLWADVFNNAGFGISILDPSNNAIRFCNQAYAAMQLMTVDEIQGRPVFDMYTPGEREHVTQQRAISDRDGQVDFEADRIRKDGSIFPAQVHCTSVYGSNGEIRYLVATMRDITAQRQMIDELQLWADVFNNSAIGIVIADPTNNIIRNANEAFASMHGMRTDEMQGRDLSEQHAPAERDRYAMLRTTLDGTDVADIEADRIRKDGSTFPARTHVSNVRGKTGVVSHLVAMVQDISDERRLRSELEQSRRLEAIGQLTAGIAHDFNNLLQGIMAHLELVDDDIGVPPATREYVGAAVRLAEECGELTSSLLSFSRKQLLAPHEASVSDFLMRFQRLLSRTLDPRIRLDVVSEPGLPPMWIDTRHLQNALLNLAINARDAMPTGGTLRIEALIEGAAAGAAPRDSSCEGPMRMHHRGPNRHILIRMSDTGSGMAPAILTKIREPFFSTKGVNGSGLGLSMVDGFVKQSGGDLRITSEVGKGTCVEIRLPLSPTYADAATAV